MEKEFRDSSSDDLVTLRDSRHFFLSRAAPGDETKVANAVFCRLLTVIVVGSIEYIVESWREKGQSRVLEPYYAKGKIKNALRISSLHTSFVEHGIDVEEKIFNEYLAIKFLRNTIVHNRWKEDEKIWVASQGYPTDVREFRMNDFDRISAVYNRLAIYTLQSEFDDPSRRARSAKIALLLGE